MVFWEMNYYLGTMKFRNIVIVGALLLASVPHVTHARQAQAAVDFDTFMKQDIQGRLRTFNRVSAETRADLVQTLIKRWIERNKARLTPEQLEVMDDNLAFVTADRYRQPMNDQTKAQAQALSARTAALFSQEDTMQALTVYATYIPPKR